MTEAPLQSSRVTLPDWLWGGNPRGLFSEADMHARVLPGSRSELMVQTNERYYRRRPNLIEPLRASGNDYSAFSVMGDDSIDEGWMPSLRSRLADRGDGGEELHELLTTYQLHIAAAPTRILGNQIRAAIDTLQEITFTESVERAFSNAQAFAIRRQDSLLHRVKLASVMTRVAHDPRLAAGDLRHLNSEQGHGEAFASSSQLHQGFLLLDAYTAPLLGAMTPAVWAVPAHKGYGPVILSLGRGAAGATGEARELIQNLGGGHGPDEVVEWPDLAQGAPWAAVDWWAGALNALMSIFTDLSTFNDTHGHYNAARHLQSLLTLEQLFRRVHSIQLTHRDRHARRVLLFTVLDTLESLTGRNLETLCTLSHAQHALERLRTRTPVASQQILLPSAERAVNALERVQEGFFMSLPDGTVPIAFEVGQPKPVSRERAAAMYIKTLRDATHGHGSHRASSRARTESLLAHHNGSVPHDLALLAYLYLVDFMANPEHLPKHLARK